MKSFRCYRMNLAVGDIFLYLQLQDSKHNSNDTMALNQRYNLIPVVR